MDPGNPSFFFRLCSMAYGILVPQPGIEPMPPALEVRSLNQWTTRKPPGGSWVAWSVVQRHCSHALCTLLCSTVRWKSRSPTYNERNRQGECKTNTEPFTENLPHDQLLFPRPQCFPQRPSMVCFSHFWLWPTVRYIVYDVTLYTQNYKHMFIDL